MESTGANDLMNFDEENIGNNDFYLRYCILESKSLYELNTR